ncbi:MAG: MBL fold metallo-hydrolase RNA specificity domain-containing protein [Candidatus Micrarchaeota archaeon]
MELKLRTGKPVLQLASGSLGLDCGHGDFSFVSHAHHDHSGFCRKAKKIIASSATLELMRARGAFTAFETAEPQDVHVELLPSGHVLGGSQLFAEEGGRSFLYTGDFKLSGGAATPRVNELLMECTYGSRKYRFPPTRQVAAEIASWVKETLDCRSIPVIGAYSLGKAQVVVGILNEAGVVPIVNNETAGVCEVYCRHGVDLQYATVGGDACREGEPFAAVVPANLVGPRLVEVVSRSYGLPVKTAVATGWSAAGAFAGVDKSFPLSDHEDFDGLVEFVKKTSPEKVFCTHGSSAEFAGELRQLGFNAIALESGNAVQKVLEVD